MNRKIFGRPTVLWLAAGMLVLEANISAQAQPAGKPSIKVISPAAEAVITTVDIPTAVEVSNFTISPEHVGMPDKPGEGHIHVMLDGLNMGVLLNFYTTPTFTLPGDSIKPGPHTLTFDLATNSHEDMEDSIRNVKINYQPASPKLAPDPSPNRGMPAVQILWPADGATVGQRFTMQVFPIDFTPSIRLEGKPNLAGYGHYHVFADVDASSLISQAMPGMDMPGMNMPGTMGTAMPGKIMGTAIPGKMEMMSMLGLLLMPGENTFPVDLSGWPAGKHTLVVQLVQNDHNPLEGARPAVLHVNVQPGGVSDAAQAMAAATAAPTSLAIAQDPVTDPPADTSPPGSGSVTPVVLAVIAGVAAIGGAFLFVGRRGQRV